MTAPSGTAAYAPDGTPVEAFALLPPGPAPALLDGALAPHSTVLDLGSGAGRIAHALIAKGHTVTCVDQCAEMLDHVRGATTILADIETLELPSVFDGVILASFLVNTPDPTQRAQLLDACARHVALGGRVFIQRLDPELVPIAVDAESEEEGVVYEMRDVRHARADDGADTFEATMRFTIDGRTWEHRYAGVVLDDAETDGALAQAGLRRTRYLDDQRTWVEATR